VALVALEIPKVGLVMENARLVRWLKAVGDMVRQGEPLLELETEKSVVEIESSESGKLVQILLQEDQEAHVGDRIAWLENGAPAAATAAAPAIAPAVEPAVAPVPAKAIAPLGTTSRQAGTENPSHRVRSSPVARRFAAEHALDLRRIEGTGPNGRVQLIDAQRAASAPPGLKALSSMRRALARSMTLSNATIPQFTVGRAVDWTAHNTVRAKLLKDLPAGTPRPSANDLLLRAVARSLSRHPELNATFWGDANSPEAGLQAANGTHVGLVVAVADGLLVPVFHDTEDMTLADLARRREEVVERARNGKLRREELEGATISISNLGVDGPDRFNAIINPPQSAILAVGRQRDCAVVCAGSVQVRPMSELTLTVDHRVADGRLASEFLASLVAILERETDE
jgi:pyruvate dehydrogenase E2 component (dihydrolipoamide acetyltransferase)